MLKTVNTTLTGRGVCRTGPLSAILAALALSVAPVVAGEFTRPTVTVGGAERVVHTPFGPIAILVDGKDTNDLVGVFRTTEPPNAGPPHHVHTVQDEVYYVLEGTYRFYLDDKTVEGGPGTTVTVPRNVSSHYENVGTDVGHMLITELPGRFVQFFIDLDEQGAATPEEIAAIQKPYGVLDAVVPASLPPCAVSHLKCAGWTLPGS